IVTDDLLLGSRVKDKESGQVSRNSDGIWKGMISSLPVPHGLRQLQKILIEREPTAYASTILSLDKILALRQPVAVPRTDMVLIAGNGAKRRISGTSHVSRSVRPPEHSAARDLQVVEMFVHSGEELIKELYDTLWAKD
ncbi:MAG TPA: hypothetical protein VMS38_29765, partial [Pseudorhodoferax sp.]|nr:hypothetical protein [Pseudorhodoferax sp.]